MSLWFFLFNNGFSLAWSRRAFYIGELHCSLSVQFSLIVDFIKKRTEGVMAFGRYQEQGLKYSKSVLSIEALPNLEGLVKLSTKRSVSW